MLLGLLVQLDLKDPLGLQVPRERLVPKDPKDLLGSPVSLEALVRKVLLALLVLRVHRVYKALPVSLG